MACKNITNGKSSEKYIEAKAVSEVKKAGGLCIKLIPTYFTGLPDRLCLFPGGRMVFVEFKSEGQKPRLIQVHVHEQLRALGFRVEVIDNVDQIKNIL